MSKNIYEKKNIITKTIEETKAKGIPVDFCLLNKHVFEEMFKTEKDIEGNIIFPKINEVTIMYDERILQNDDDFYLGTY